MTRVEPSRGLWFPFAVFGIIVLGATGFYWENFPLCPRGGIGCGILTRSAPVDFASSGLAPILPFHDHWVGIYWLTAIPIGFVLSGWYFRRTESMLRLALAASVTLGILVLIVASSSVLGWPILVLPGDLTDRGLVGLLVIALGLAVWAFAERRPRLWVATGLFLVVALVSCRYDISNVVGFGTSPSAAELPNVVLPGLCLLLGGLTFGLLESRRARSVARELIDVRREAEAGISEL